jgi:hypothetical protein
MVEARRWASLRIGFKKGEPAQRMSAPSAPPAGIGTVEYLAAFRLRANRFDDGLQSISFDSRCPLYRNAASGCGGMGSEGGVGPVDDLRIGRSA